MEYMEVATVKKTIYDENRMLGKITVRGINVVVANVNDPVLPVRSRELLPKS